MQATLMPMTLPYHHGGAPRTEGVHLSGLLRSMAFDYGFLDKKWALDELKLVEVEGDGDAWWSNLDDDSKVRISIGFAWETWYLPQLPEVVYQPGELSLSGIFMTRDGESLDVIVRARRAHYTVALHEVKTTSKSINTVGHLAVSNPKNWMWLMQTKCYAKAMETCLVYLHILYLYGDYSYPLRPVLHVWRIEYTQDELDQAWELVTDYRDAKRRLGVI